MFELYKRVNKSIEYPRGAKQITEGENPFADGACLLCISAQDQVNKSIFGLTKTGARMARVRVNGDDGARIPIEEVPVSFLSIKPDREKNTEEENVKEFVERYINPLLIDEEGKVKTKGVVARNLRNINIVANCNGNERAIHILEETEKRLGKSNFDKKDIDNLLSQIALISFQTEMDLSGCKASVIDFHNTYDSEVRINPDNISDEMIEKNESSLNNESVHRVGNRMEVLIKGEDSHTVRGYIENGNAVPVIVHTVISSVLENSIENNKSDTLKEELSIDKLYDKSKTIMKRIEHGEKKEHLIKELDESLQYGGHIEKLSDRELELINSQERAVELYDRTNRHLKQSEEDLSKLRKMQHKIMDESKKMCTEGTHLRLLQSSGWQMNPKQEQIINSTKSDRKTIEEQKEQIKNLQLMLNRTLQFADEVRNSVVGKVFFRKSIKELPSGEDKKIE